MAYMFDPNDVKLNEGLRTISQAYRNEDTVWREVAPIIPVTKRSGKYFVFDAFEAFATTDDTTAPHADAKQIYQKLSDDNYSVQDHALEAPVSVEALEEADDELALEGNALEGVRGRLELNHELRVAQQLFSAATYTADYKATLSGTAQWSDATSDPIQTIIEKMDVPLQRPNRLLLGHEVWRRLRSHPKVVSAIYPTGGNAGTGGLLASTQQLAEVLEIEQIVVGRARYNTAKDGQPGALARIWGDHALLYYRDPAPSRNTATFAATFSETQTNIVRYLDQRKGVKGSVYVKDGWNEDIKIISARSAFFFENAVS